MHNGILLACCSHDCEMNNDGWHSHKSHRVVAFIFVTVQHELILCREAARECRRKKKEYVRCLENRVAVLESQNQALIGELRALKELYLPKNNQE